jgi:capsular exopolysaccharide synthesis family protein
MNQLVPTQQHSALPADEVWAHTSRATAFPDRGGTPIDFGRLLLVIRRRWRLVSIFVLAAGIGTWYQARQKPRAYHASAVIQLIDTRHTLASTLADQDDRLPAMYMTTSEAEIIRSRAVANAVVDSEPLGLRINAVGFTNAFLSDISLDPNVPPVQIPVSFAKDGFSVGSGRRLLIPYGTPARSSGVSFIITGRPQEATVGAIAVASRDRAADKLLSGLDVTPRKQTNLIDITYTAAARLTAKRVVNAVARTYQALDILLAQQQLHRRRIFLEGQLARTDAQLSEADRALSTFRNQQQAYSSQEKFRAQQEILAGLDVRREDLDGNRKMARSLLRRFETGDEAARKAALGMLASAPEISGDRSPVPDLYKKLLEYQQSRAELTSGPLGKATTHPDVQRIDTLIASTQAELISAAKGHVALLDARIEALDEVRTRNAGTMEQFPAAEATETRLQQNAETLRIQAAMLRTEYEHARIAEAAEVGQVEIVDFATRASAVQTGRIRLIAFAIFLGFLAGGGVALLLEGADHTVKRRDDLELALRIPVLSTIPQIQSDRHGSAMPSKMAMPNERKTKLTRRRQIALASVIHARSPEAEAFRRLSTSLFYSRAGRSARRILVTSPTEGDGKTSVASNLAITLAHQRRRVLLVDCDIYGKLHNIFQLPASPGLSDVVLNHVHPGEVIQPTGIEGLCLMTSGKPSSDGADVMNADRMRAMLKDLTHDFDLVVLDCSPILALADSTTLSVNSDAVLLVVRAGHTATLAAVEGMRQLSTVGANVAGVVLNDPENRTRQYGSYYPMYGYART